MEAAEGGGGDAFDVAEALRDTVGRADAPARVADTREKVADARGIAGLRAEAQRAGRACR